MSDTLKNLALGFLGLLSLHGSLERRARRDAEHQVRDVFQNTGSLSARVEGRGMLGMLANDVWSVDIYGTNQIMDRLPFYVHPRPGWKGSIRHLRFHFQNISLYGFTVRSFAADIPFATYDLGEALYRDKLVLRSAGVGSGMVVAGRYDIQRFLMSKYKETLSDVNISTINQKLQASGYIDLLGVKSSFAASGDLVVRAGRYIDLAAAVVRLNGILLAPAAARTLMRNINPLLDAESDLHIGGFFRMERVVVGQDEVTIEGSVTIPPESSELAGAGDTLFE